MAAGLYSELTDTGERIRRSLVAPLETRIQMDQLREAKAAREKATSEAEVRKGHIAKSAAAIGKVYGGTKGIFVEEGMLGGMNPQSMAAVLRQQAGTGKGTSKTKPGFLETSRAANEMSAQLTALAMETAKEFANAPDDKTREAIAAKQAAIAKMSDNVKLLFVSMDKEAQASYLMNQSKKLEDQLKTLSPENIDALKASTNELIKNTYGISGDVEDAKKNTKELFGTEIDLSGFVSSDTIFDMALKSQLNNSGKGKAGRDEIRSVLETKKPEDLAKIVNDPEAPMQAKVLAKVLLENGTLSDTLSQSIEKALEKKSPEEIEKMGGKVGNTLFGKKVGNIVKRKKGEKELRKAYSRPDRFRPRGGMFR